MMVVNGATTMLQSRRIGPIGSGLIVVTYPAAIAIPFCVIALREGGPATMAALVVVSGLFQIAVSMRLSLLRRVVTPAVSGTFIILMVITTVAVIFGHINDVPEGAPAAAGPVCIVVTLAVTIGLLLRGTGQWRVWAPIIGIGAGWIAAAALGIYDSGPVNEAAPIGLPLESWPGLGFDFGVSFWSLLPAFLLLSTITVFEGASIGLSTQQVSSRTPGAMDYRRVQGGTACTGAGTLLAGLVGGMPLAVPARGVIFVQQTGCASRHVGLIIGAMLIVVAFFPKSWSLFLGIPGPVITTFLLVMVGPLFVEGMKLIIRDAPDYRKSLVVGAAIVIGLGFQFQLVSLPIGGLWGPMFQNALTSGGIAAVLLTVLAEFTMQRNRRIQTELSLDALPRINAFLKDFSASRGWNDDMTARMQAVAEETLHLLAQHDGESADGPPKRLLVTVGVVGPVAELEFVSAPGESQNLEDRIALLTTPGPEVLESGLRELETRVERDVSLQLLRHYSSSVAHRQYQEAEVITVRIAPSQ